jgi:hypothetical protein
MKNIDGTWKYGKVIWGNSSAEFSYDELNLCFSNDLGYTKVANCDTERGYRTTTYRDEDGYWEDTSEPIEKIGEITTFEDMWQQVFNSFI